MTEIELLIKSGKKLRNRWKKLKSEEKCPLTDRTWQEVLDGKLVNSSTARGFKE